MAQMNMPEQSGMDTRAVIELHNQKKKVEEDLEGLKKNKKILDEAIDRYKSALQAIEQLSSASENQEMFIPLTASIYVPGQLIEKDNVTLDIGTGYHTNKSTDEARKYIHRRINLANQEIALLSNLIKEKHQIIDQFQFSLRQFFKPNNR